MRCCVIMRTQVVAATQVLGWKGGGGPHTHRKEWHTSSLAHHELESATSVLSLLFSKACSSPKAIIIVIVNGLACVCYHRAIHAFPVVINV